MSKDNKKTINWIWIITGLFLAEVLVRFLCSNYPIGVRTYRDELYYFQIAKSIWNNHSISVYGVGTRFQKILYPILISPAFSINNPVVRMKIITLINSVLVSSSIFPAYLFTKKITNKNDKIIALSLLIWAFLPDMCFSSTFMAEILYLPMGLWELYLLTILLLEENKKKQIILSFLLGGFTFLVYITKEDGLIYLFGFAFVCIFQAIKTKSILSFFRRCPGVILGFGLFYGLFKFVLYNGVEKYYSPVSTSIIGTHFKLEYFFYALAIHLIFVIIAWMFFSLILPAVFLKRMNEEQKISFIFFAICMLINAISISFAISTPEDLGKAIPRQHMRYYVPLVYPAFVFLLCVLEQKKQDESIDFISKRKLYLFIVAGVFLSAVLFGIKTRIPFVTVDNNTLRIYSYLFDFHFTDMSDGAGELVINNGLVLFKILLFIYVIVGCIVTFSKNKKISIIFFVMATIIIELFNNYLSYKYIRQVYQKNEDYIADAVMIDNYLREKEGNILVAAKQSGIMGIFDNQIIDSYLNKDYCVTNEEQLRNNSYEKDYIDLNNNPFVAIHEAGNISYKNFNDYEYVIAYDEIPFVEGKAEQITFDGVDTIYLYHILTPGQLWISYSVEEN